MRVICYVKNLATLIEAMQTWGNDLPQGSHFQSVSTRATISKMNDYAESTAILSLRLKVISVN